MAVSRGPLGRKYDIGWSVPDDETTVVRPTVSIPSTASRAPVVSVPSAAPSRLRPVPAVPDVTEPSQPDVPRRSGLVATAERSGQLLRSTGEEPQEVTLGDVARAEQQFLSNVSRSPAISGGQRADIEEQLSEIVEPDTGPSGLRADRILGGILGFGSDLIPDFVKEGTGEALGTIGKVVGTPLRVIESYAKEVSDMFREGEAVSLVEFGKQSVDPDFNPEYRPVASVVDLLGGEPGSTVEAVDKLLSTTTKIVADPTLTTLAVPLKYQGAAGRLAASQDFLASRTALTLDDATKARVASDIYRYGPDAAPTAIRSSLVDEGVFPKAGVRVAGATVPGTETLGSGVSMAIGGARARVGDVLGGLPAAYLTPKSRVGLVGVARDQATADEALAAFATNAAATRAKADAAQAVGELAGKYNPLVKDLSKLSEADQSSVVRFLEGDITADELGPDLLRFAEPMRGAFDEALDSFNQARKLISDRYGLRIPEVPKLSNYVHRSTTRRARIWSARGSNAATVKNVARELGVDVPSLRSAEGFTLSRSNTGKFLNERLQTGPVLKTLKDGTQIRAGTIAEMNDIAERQLGFRFFEENAGQIVSNYFSAMARQFQRESFIGHLFQLRPGAIKPLLTTGPMAKKVRGIVEEYEQLLGQVERAISGARGVSAEGTVRREGLDLVEDVLQSVRKTFDPSFMKGRNMRSTVRRMSAKLDELDNQIALVRRDAEARRVEIDQGALDVLVPLENRIRVLQAAIDAGDGEIAAATEWLRQKHAALFPDVMNRPTAPAELAKDIIADAESRLSGAARTGAVRKASTAQAAAKRAQAEVDVAGQRVPLAEARKELGKRQSEWTKAQKAYDKALGAEPTIREARNLEARRVRNAASLDAKKSVVGVFDQWDETVGEMFRDDIASIRQLLEEAPKVGDSSVMTREWLDKVESTLTSLSTVEMDPIQRQTLTQVMSHLFAEEAKLAKISEDIFFGEGVEQAVASQLVDAAFTKDLREGWTAIKQQMNTQVSPELRAQIEGVYENLIADLKDIVDKQPNLLGQLYRESLQYFKSTAVLTAGFTVRNAITAAWNNWINGVTLEQYREAAAFGRLVNTNGLDGAYKAWERRAFTRAVEGKGMRKMSATDARAYARGEVARMRSALDAVFATGGGKNVDEIIPVVGRKNRRTFENRAADAVAAGGDYVFRPFAGRLSAGARRANETVELYVARLPLALNGMDQGFSTAANAARIARNQFDYTDLSQFDEAAKLFIPFWVFATRNIPLQVVNRAITPIRFEAYRKLAEMEEYDPELAQWRRERNPIPLFGKFLDLDLPFQTLDQQFGQFTSLAGVLGQTAPSIRTPIELATGQRIAFGSAYPYSQDYTPAAAGDILGLLAAGLAGDVARDVSGDLVAREATVQPIQSSFPAVQNVQRYLGTLINAVGGDRTSAAGRIVGGQEQYYERDTGDEALRFLGINLRGVSPAEASSTNRATIAQINELERELRRLGFTD